MMISAVDNLESAGVYDGLNTANAQLLLNLVKSWQASDLGNICGFFRVPHDWRCPCCFRDKSEIARLDKNNGLLCAIVLHHDHMEDYVRRKLRACSSAPKYREMEAHIVSLIRFSPTLICNDCNVFDSAIKKTFDPPSYFSFAPYEIAALVSPELNLPHDIKALNQKKLLRVITYAQPMVEFLCDRLQAKINAISRSGDQ